ncbi:RICIN domain-containing protein [Actinoplanes sp. NPDC051859]|uniref:RICIN domain-containing protein n=1 Tax=Actinoplanes sp. NPDC051859 TaxID=3363909 RepID=UPI0037959FD7
MPYIAMTELPFRSLMEAMDPVEAIRGNRDSRLPQCEQLMLSSRLARMTRVERGEMKFTALRRWLAAVSVGIFIIVGLSPTAAHANVPGVAAGWSVITNLETGMVLAIKGGVGEPAGAPAIQWHYPRTVPVPQDQQWIMGPNDTGKAIRNGGTAHQFALSIQGNSHANGARVVQWWHQPNNRYQSWRTEFAYHNGDFWYKIINNATGKCLAVANGGDLNAGAAIIQWTCGNGPDQKWHFSS